MIRLLSKILNLNQNKWWVRISTTSPQCVYYFGPFNSAKEAKAHRNGYIEDLVLEKAWGITVELVQCQPNYLTISKE